MVYFAKTLQAYKYGNITRKQLREKAQPVTPKKTIGRNDLCPCNSGKKYKKCCLK